MIGGILPAVGVAVDWVRFRTLQALGVVVLAALALGVVLALVSDDPKTVLCRPRASSARRRAPVGGPVVPDPEPDRPTLMVVRYD